MADPTFEFTLRLLGGRSFQGAFVATDIGNDSFQITSVSGQSNGSPITGLSTFGGSDNVLRFRQGRVPQTATSDNGISFTIDGVDYRFVGNAGNATGESSAEPGISRSGSYTFNWTNGPPVCFVTGTRIRTTRGDIPVEQLRVGDIAITATGKRRRIKWIGSRTLMA